VKLPVICRSFCLAASVSLIQGGHKGGAGARRSALSAAWCRPAPEGLAMRKVLLFMVSTAGGWAAGRKSVT